MGKFDTRMKEFWRDNGHFADLFNAVVFHGREILKPEMLSERDTDESAEIRSRRKYLDSVTKTRDVVKKAAFDTEFVLLGIESQLKTDYSMPAAELFSIRKSDRLHSIVTVCLYYGEDAWDGPKSLRDMLLPTEKEILGLIPDYPLNLIEIRESDHLKFHNQDVDQIFTMVRKIYRKTVDEIFRNIRKDLASVVGAIVGSESIEKLADNSEEGGIDLCRALNEMMQEREREGEIRGRILVYREFKLSSEQIAERLNITVSEVEALCHEEKTLCC